MTVTAATALFVVVVMTATLVIVTLMVATFVMMATATVAMFTHSLLKFLVNNNVVYTFSFSLFL